MMRWLKKSRQLWLPSAGLLCSLAGVLVLVGCKAGIPPAEISTQHIRTEDTQKREQIPPPANYTIPSGPLGGYDATAKEKKKTYSIVVRELGIKELLFALGRDAKLNVDVSPRLEGTVTMNAINQTLSEILSRLSKQVEVRFEMHDGTLVALPDEPYLENYRVDYVNISRTSKGSIAAVSQISGGAASAISGSSNASQSSVSIDDVSVNEFWKTIEQNIKDLLRETDKIIPTSNQGLQAISNMDVVDVNDVASAADNLPPPPRLTAREKQIIQRGAQAAVKDVVSGSLASVGLAGSAASRGFSYREAASVIVNRETGIITVRATARQQAKVKSFIDEVMQSARRQVLIEATIVEVTLSNDYQHGIDWGRFRSDRSGFGLSQTPTQSNSISSQIPIGLSWVQQGPFPFNVAFRLLEQFGTVKVLSSPKLSVMNNQTAVLKVVDNVVYFTVSADSVLNNNQTVTNYTTTPQSVAVGLVMGVTAQISKNDEVILNIRPSISSISGYQTDPNPNLLAGVPNRVPQISTREMESVMRVSSGNTVVLGGLIEDKIDFNNSRVPVLGRVPIAGELFNYRNNAVSKSELVVFLRPVVVRDASLEGDYSSFKGQVPDESFMMKDVPNATRHDKILK